MYLGTMWWIVLVIFATAVVRFPSGLHCLLGITGVEQQSIVDISQKMKLHLLYCSQVVSVCTFLLQWGGCCIQHTDHTGTHVRVQVGWGYGFDMHRGRHMLEGTNCKKSITIEGLEGCQY